MLIDEQVFVLKALTSGMLARLETDKVKDFTAKLLQHAKQEHLEIFERINSTGDLSDEDGNSIVDITKRFLEEYLNCRT